MGNKFHFSPISISNCLLFSLCAKSDKEEMQNGEIKAIVLPKLLHGFRLNLVFAMYDNVKNDLGNSPLHHTGPKKVYIFFLFNSNNYTIYPSDMDNKYIFCLIYNNGKTYITW
jgi:hypothetical protein